MGFVLLGVLLTGWLMGIEQIEKIVFDLHHKNPYVSTSSGIDSILNGFPVVAKKRLPKALIASSGLNKNEFKTLIDQQQFYCIHKKDVYRKIVGDFRIKDFFSSDMGFYTHSYFSKDTLYWGIDKRILYKLVELQDALEERGYDRNALTVRFGHRSPRLNKLIHGASRSRHIAGEAVDITIGDINKDGTYTDEDKQLVLEICEKEIIRNEGGMGLYPGTRVVHLDVRGHRARWNSY
jgi:hypothetical protein